MATRVPPHNLDEEVALLGAMMLNRDAIHAAIDHRISADDFYKPAHGVVFDAITTLVSQGEPVDPTTVSEVLRANGHLDMLGGKAELLRIQAATPASANAGAYAPVVAGLAQLRRLIHCAGRIAELGYDSSEDPRVALDQAERLLFEVADRHDTERTVSLRRSLDTVFERIEETHTQGPGIPTGFHDLDRLLLGLRPANLYLVAARPSMGKTAFAVGVAERVAHTNPVAMFSLEMDHTDLSARMLAGEAHLDLRKILAGRLDTGEMGRLEEAASRIGSHQLWINDDPDLTLMEVRSKARRIKSRQNLGLIVVDYLQLMRAEGETRQLAVADLSRGLKLLARELQCPVVALSQLNRQLEYRGDKRPMLADLRDSGSLEQDADVVMFLYRDEVYNPTSDDVGTAEVIVAKHRNGPLGTVKLAFLGHQTRFADMARQEM